MQLRKKEAEMKKQTKPIAGTSNFLVYFYFYKSQGRYHADYMATERVLEILDYCRRNTLEEGLHKIMDEWCAIHMPSHSRSK